MAVYKRAYRPYEGPLTPAGSRFLVLARYGLQEIFESRVLTAYLVFCLLPFLVEAAVVYVSNSPAARFLLRIPGTSEALPIGFFVGTLTVQGFLAYALTAWVAPVLISPDLVNGALPLYLSRPLSRAEYVFGKMIVLFTLLSLITWVPGLTLFGIQAGLAGSDWAYENLRAAGATFLGAWIWIVVLTLLGLAISAWIRWRLVASAAIFGIIFMGSAFGEAWGEVLRNPWGRLANPSYLVALVWRDLFFSRSSSLANEVFANRGMADLPTGVALLALAAVCVFSLWLLDRRLRAREVV